MDGMFDSLPNQGNYIVTTIDAACKPSRRADGVYAVAIETSTGEILMMVSSPNEMTPQGNNYMKMLYNIPQCSTAP